MKYPKLNELYASREMIDVFRGYNHNLSISESEFYDMVNLSSDNYPILSPRRQRGVYASPSCPGGMVAKENLCYVNAPCFVMGNTQIDMQLPAKDAKGNSIHRTLISMGAYVIIMPDKKYINTSTSDWGYIEESFESSENIKFSLCKLNGDDYEDMKIQSEQPSDPVDKEYWLDTSETPNVLKQYSSTTSKWSTIPTTYIKIETAGIDKKFEVNDGVTISGVGPSFLVNDGETTSVVETDALNDLNASMVIREKGDGYIIVTGIIDKVYEQNAGNQIKVERKMPDMDFIIESGNRLWGCKYGTTAEGKVVNEIYASKLGDFKNWNCFMGISTDSYAASVGSDGPFTGAITFLGYPTFFKENGIHKVYGNYPANYQIPFTACRGVQSGCHRSLAIVNEVLYYKSRLGVCAYDGSLPIDVSYALGDVNYSNAAAGVLGNKYYISMSDQQDEYHLFVYDTSKGIWHKEDDTEASEFCNYHGELYYIDRDGNQIKTVRGTGVLDTNAVKWQATTGVIGIDSPDKKYVSRMDVRMSLNVGSRVMFFAEYDSSGEWIQLFTMTGTTLKTFPVSIRPQRCDHMRLKIVGEGDAKIYSICKTIEQGSDV